MTPGRIPKPGPRRALVAATIATGAAIGAGLLHHPDFALGVATIAAAAALSVLRHLVNLEESK